MFILPSILEYSQFSLETKLNYLQKNYLEIKKIQNQNPILHLHLDFVLPQFAKDRKVMTSFLPNTILQELDNQFNPKKTEKTKDYTPKLQLSIHLMGALEDMLEMYNFFEKYEFNPQWQYQIFVSPNYTQSWQTLLNPKNIQIGTWLDLNQWSEKEMAELNFEDNQWYLLMSVVAGKSGQKLEINIKNKALEIVKNNPKSNFILDGGWQIDEKIENADNVSFVSYSSFWNQVLKNN